MSDSAKGKKRQPPRWSPGSRIGKNYTVLEVLGYRIDVWWYLVECDCGEVVERSQRSLKGHHNKKSAFCRSCAHVKAKEKPEEFEYPPAELDFARIKLRGFV